MKQHCPNCPGAASHRVFSDAHATVLRCDRCGLQFAAEYPEYEDADRTIYSYDYFERVLQPQELAERDQIFGRLLADLEARLGRKGRLLDIGAGEGSLVRAALSRGWQAEGTEVSSAMVEYTTEHFHIQMHHGALEELRLPAESFDAIVLNHVLEHVRDPGSTLVEVGRLLRKDGLVRIEVPNLAGLSSQIKNLQSRFRMKKSPWKHYSTDHHFWFFTPQTLRTTLQHSGLHIVELLAPGKKKENPHLGDRLYRRAHWGGHLVALAAPARTTTTTSQRASESRP